MKHYSIKIIDGHHVVDMSYESNNIETAIRNAANAYGQLIKIASKNFIAKLEGK